MGWPVSIEAVAAIFIGYLKMMDTRIRYANFGKTGYIKAIFVWHVGGEALIASFLKFSDSQATDV